MFSATTIFFLGPTGYIGGAVLQLLLDDPRYEITALVRDQAKADVLAKKFGVRTVVGTMEDEKLLEQEAAKADVIFNIAALWIIPGIKALLNGSKTKFEQTGKKPIFIHTSGAGAVAGEDARGEFIPGKVYVDTDVETMTSLSSEHIHNIADTMVRLADVEGGYVRSYILYPPMVWGQQRGALADAGLTNVHPPALALPIKFSIARGQGGVIGKGLNQWSHVEVHEQADLFNLVLKAALADPSFPSGNDATFFPENGKFTMIDAAEAWTKALHVAGKSRMAEPEPFTDEELAQFGPGGIFARYTGSTTLCSGERGRKLGWKPVLDRDAFMASLEVEVKALLEAA
ncbi:NAD(P)-binding protein [Peniophora sp. CONT]|nr:NAD(P)-binding protein [Peniophora sp. CONT]